MRRPRLLWQLFLPFLGVTLLSILAVAWFAGSALRAAHDREAEAGLDAILRMGSPEVGRAAVAGPAAIDALCKDLGRRGGVRFTVVAADGKVLGDSEESPARMDNHGDRPEVREALAGRRGVSVRYSHSLRETLMYVANPFGGGGAPSGVIRAATPVARIREGVFALWARIALASLVLSAGAALALLWISRRASRPLEDLKEGAERFAAGDLARPLRLPAARELAALAEAMNRMAA
ncbi:MAG: HAMP domain-containing protein, partial [Planctomycetes bacterium]|nr:HAMP domain-containing protein [Planctomycetota bacterium]